MFANKTRVLAVLAAAALLGASAGAARADKGVLEVDAVFGWHLISTRSDLGKPDSRKEVPDDGPVFGARVGYFVFERLSLEAELVGAPTSARGDDNDTAFIFAYRAQAVFELASMHDLGGTLSLVGGVGGMAVGDSSRGGIDGGAVLMPHLGLNAKVAFGERWGLRFDGRLFIVPASNLDDDASVTDDWEVSLGVYMLFGGKSRALPAAAPAEPAAPADADGDGLLGASDKCPSEAEDKDGFQDGDGCPDADDDGDGVPDGSDKCPKQAEDKDGFQDDDGCPEADNDGDGVADASDKCPDAAEDKDGFQDDDACPDPDNDGDGVLDADDKCAAELETRNGFQDKDGCADVVPKAVAKFTGVIPGINFETGKATITQPSFKTLDAAVKVLTEYKDLALEIGGHTDDVGDPEQNKKLSQDRAQAVKDYMVSKGVAEERLRAVGYGQEKPLDPAKTVKARAKNRRVEFTLVTE